MKNKNYKNNVENRLNNGSMRASTPTIKFKGDGVGALGDHVDPISAKGITLIALIITIILMLILAGVVISLTIGENGIFNVAKYAVIKTEEEKAREKLELALADLQAKKYTDIENYDEDEYIDNYLIHEGMSVEANIVTVDGYKFTIDRSVPKIGENVEQGELKKVRITTPYVGTTSFTTKVSYVDDEEEIETYIYKIDNEEITILDKEYTTPEEQELEPESTHTVKVIAKYKDGTQVESNIITIKTEARTYIMQNGKLQGEEGAIILNAELTQDIENGSVRLETGPTTLRSGYVIPYDLTQYKKVKIDIEVIGGNGNLGFGIMDKDEDCFTSKKDDYEIISIKQDEEILKSRDTYSLNIKEIQGIWQIELIGGARNNATSVIAYIYGLWLEK